jgi:hypothetical protein
MLIGNVLPKNKITGQIKPPIRPNGATEMRGAQVQKNPIPILEAVHHNFIHIERTTKHATPLLPLNSCRFKSGTT